MPRFLVNLSPIGVDYMRETTAASPADAVNHAIYKYFDTGRKTPDMVKRDLALFVYDQQQYYGVEEWDAIVQEMAQEEVENPEKPPELPIKEDKQPKEDKQLQLFEFDKQTMKEHPGTDIAHSWKAHNKMQFVDYDKLAEIIGDKQATYGVKLDGELVCLYWDGHRADTVTVRGTIRTNMPPTKEAASLLGKYKSAAFLGELHVVDDDGKPRSYMQAATALRNPTSGMDNYLRLAIFDVYQLDGIEHESQGIDERMKVVTEVFGKGKTVYPAIHVTGTVDKAEELWSQLEAKGWEGLVVHFGADLYKVKPIQSYDMVVVAINKSKFIEQISAVVVAFIDKEGRYRMSGSIGGGFNDEERIRLLEWAERNKVSEDEKRIWVDPLREPLIVEIEAVEVNEKPMPAMQFGKGKWITLENKMSGTLRFPQFVRERDDKEPTYGDVPVDQVLREEEIQ